MSVECQKNMVVSLWRLKILWFLQRNQRIFRQPSPRIHKPDEVVKQPNRLKLHQKYDVSLERKTNWTILIENSEIRQIANLEQKLKNKWVEFTIQQPEEAHPKLIVTNRATKPLGIESNWKMSVDIKFEEHVDWLFEAEINTEWSRNYRSRIQVWLNI